MIFMKEGDSGVLNHLVQSLEEAETSLEEAHKKDDYDGFSKSKQIILQIQKKILEEAQ